MAKNNRQREADTFTRITVMGLTVLLLWGEVSRVEAGGCSSFGHSCFGAHGKRAEGAPGYNGNLDTMSIIAPVAQRLAVSPGGAPVMNGDADNYEAGAVPIAGNRISPYLIEWILASNRRQERPVVEDMPAPFRRRK